MLSDAAGEEIVRLLKLKWSNQFLPVTDDSPLTLQYWYHHELPCEEVKRRKNVKERKLASMWFKQKHCCYGYLQFNIPCVLIHSSGQTVLYRSLFDVFHYAIFRNEFLPWLWHYRSLCQKIWIVCLNPSSSKQTAYSEKKNFTVRIFLLYLLFDCSRGEDVPCNTGGQCVYCTVMCHDQSQWPPVPMGYRLMGLPAGRSSTVCSLLQFIAAASPRGFGWWRTSKLCQAHQNSEDVGGGHLQWILPHIWDKRLQHIACMLIINSWSHWTLTFLFFSRL